MINLSLFIEEKNFEQVIKDIFWEGEDIEQYLNSLEEYEFKDFFQNFKKYESNDGKKEVINYCLNEYLFKLMSRNNCLFSQKRVMMMIKYYNEIVERMVEWLERQIRKEYDKKKIRACYTGAQKFYSALNILKNIKK